MLSIKALGLLMKITSRLDLKDVITELRSLDIFKEAKSAEEAKAQLSKEKLSEVALVGVNALLPQFDVIGEFLPELVAAYKNISIEEAEQADALEVVTEIMSDEGIISFFKTALRKKVEQQS